MQSLKSIPMIFGKSRWKKSTKPLPHFPPIEQEVMSLERTMNVERIANVERMMNVERIVRIEGGTGAIKERVPVSKCSDDDMEEYFRPASKNRPLNTLCNFCCTVDFKRLFTASPSEKLPDATCYMERYISWSETRVQQNYSCPFCDLLRAAVRIGTGRSKMPVSIQDGSILGHIEDYDYDEFQQSDGPQAGRRLWVTVIDRSIPAFKKSDELNYNSSHVRLECANQRRDFYGCIALSIPRPIPLVEQYPSPTERLKEENGIASLAKSWLSSCERNHGLQCSHSLPQGQFRALRLIDVRRDCIVPAPPDSRYVALSYVWGKAEQLKLTKANFDTLMTDGALSEPSLKMPQTIRHAILLCQMLGENYLWVDRICIIQDSEDDKNEQIADMDLVYRGAAFTVVAAAGRDANHGLPGLQSSKSSHRRTVENMPFVVTQRNAVCGVLDSAWNHRGWTFQELVLSRRILAFTESQVVFYCKKAIWRQDGVLEEPKNDKTALGLYRGRSAALHLREDTAENTNGTVKDVLSTEMIGALGNYQELVKDYVLREFADENQIINGFTGITNVLSPSLGRFRQGLPEDCFDAAIIWHSKDEFPLPRRDGFPSWSWAGWKSYSCNIRFYDYGKFTYGFGAYIKWFRIVDDQGQLEEISNSKPWGYSGVLLHPTLKAHITARSLLYLHLDNHPGIIRDDLSRYLVFTTSYAKLKVGREFKRYRAWEPANDYKEFKLYTRTSQYSEEWDEYPIGSIRLSNSWRQKQRDEEMPFAVVGNIAGSVYVMLLEWRGNVAYRIQMASQSIHDNSWWRARPEKKLIVLG